MQSTAVSLSLCFGDAPTGTAGCTVSHHWESLLMGSTLMHWHRVYMLAQWLGDRRQLRGGFSFWFPHGTIQFSVLFTSCCCCRSVMVIMYICGLYVCLQTLMTRQKPLFAKLQFVNKTNKVIWQSWIVNASTQWRVCVCVCVAWSCPRPSRYDKCA